MILKVCMPHKTMDTPTLKTRVRELEAQVRPYQKAKNSTGMFLPAMAIEPASLKIYGGIFAVLFFVLLFSRPAFLYNTTVLSGKKSFSWKKLFIYWLSISSVLCLALFAYNYRQSVG
jgi:hypothetical protein